MEIIADFIFKYPLGVFSVLAAGVVALYFLLVKLYFLEDDNLPKKEKPNWTGTLTSNNSRQSGTQKKVTQSPSNEIGKTDTVQRNEKNREAEKLRVENAELKALEKKKAAEKKRVEEQKLEAERETQKLKETALLKAEKAKKERKTAFLKEAKEQKAKLEAIRAELAKTELKNENKIREKPSSPVKRPFIKKLEQTSPPLPEAIKEPETPAKWQLRTKYEIPLTFEQELPWQYPIVKFPKKGSVVRSYREGATKRRGYKEAAFQKALERHLSNKFKILGNARINTGANTRPYEPDIALIDFRSGMNIRIDIEIDEPYSGISRTATHCEGVDENRDYYFNDRGWIVIRFSEIQVHQKELQCVNFVAQVIKSIHPEYEVSDSLVEADLVERNEQWDLVQAQKWEKQKFREQYLNHTFGEVWEKQETLERDLSTQELEEEKLVEETAFEKPETSNKIGFNLKNIHARDSRIEFFPEAHVYKIDGVPAPSVSTVISDFFQAFDSQHHGARVAGNRGISTAEVLAEWENKGRVSREKGTYLHEQIEKYYLGQKHAEPEEFYQFKSFVAEHRMYKPFRSEWRIFDDRHLLAGTIDFIGQDHHEFDMFDWKRSAKTIHPNGSPKTDNWGKYGLGELSHIPDTNFQKYSLQQSLYRNILEKNYGIKIRNMYLVIFHPDYGRYFKVPVPYLEQEAKSILLLKAI